MIYWIQKCVKDFKNGTRRLISTAPACNKNEAEVTDLPNDITAISLVPPLRTARLDGRKPQQIDLQPDTEQRTSIAHMLGLEGLRKFRFTARLAPLGRKDWELTGMLGATVVQTCAVTLEPVTTRIDEPVTRRFLADLPEPQGLEIEMPEDDSVEPLGAEIDISAIAIEALALALPAFPRSDSAQKSAELSLESRPPGSAPIEDEKIKPFAKLAGLKAKLESGEQSEE